MSAAYQIPASGPVYPSQRSHNSISPRYIGDVNSIDSNSSRSPPHAGYGYGAVRDSRDSASILPSERRGPQTSVGYSNTGLQGASADNGVIAVPVATGRRRKVLCAAVVEDDEVSTFYDEPGRDDVYRNTVCMDHHVLSRMEEDLKRAEMRRANPESGIPDRGPRFEHDVVDCLSARTPTRSTGRSLSTTPHAAKKPAGAYHLPPMRTPSSRLRRSNSRVSSCAPSPVAGPRTPAHSRSGASSSRGSSRVNKGTAATATPMADSTADFINRERARGIQRRVQHSLDVEQLRRSPRTSPGSVSSSRHRHAPAPPAVGDWRDVSPRRHLNLADNNRDRDAYGSYSSDSLM